jgi:hypothetical protein
MITHRFGRGEVRLPEIHTAEVRLAKFCPGEVRLVKLGLELCPTELRPVKVHHAEVRLTP